jgi:hypothetical protein
MDRNAESDWQFSFLFHTTIESIVWNPVRIINFPDGLFKLGLAS